MDGQSLPSHQDQRSVLVNEEFGRRYLQPAGASLPKLNFFLLDWQIVGVVSNVRTPALEGGTAPEIYVPMEQMTATHAPVRTDWAKRAVLLVRTIRRDDLVLKSIHEHLRQLGVSSSSIEGATLADLLRRHTAPTTNLTIFFSIVAVANLALIALGLATVTTVVLRNRTREIGIRLALGLAPERAGWLVLKEILGASLAWAVIAVVGSSGLLELAQAHDPRLPGAGAFEWSLAAGILLLCAGLGGLSAAVRASRMDASVALRSE